MVQSELPISVLFYRQAGALLSAMTTPRRFQSKLLSERLSKRRDHVVRTISRRHSAERFQRRIQLAQRLDYDAAAPAGVKALGAVYSYIMHSGLPKCTS